jgi:Ca-activated chloride channel homolog
MIEWLRFAGRFFDQPLIVAVAVPVILLMLVRLRSNARISARLLRRWPGVARMVPDRRWRQACGVLFTLFITTAIAGPRLGPVESVETAKPRDVMLVVDLSRSMLAEQPSRLEKASRALGSLADALEKSGAARVGMVVFASKAELAFPLTGDAGHLRHIAQRLADVPPPSVEGDAALVSGTRIGEALRLAVSAVAGHPGAEIVLLSDGDDPADDEEWQTGIAAARAAGIPVHTVTVGEPGLGATIPWKGDVLRYEDRIVRSRIRPELLESIARRTGGLALTAAKGTLPLGKILHDHWREHPLAGIGEARPMTLRTPLRAPFLFAALLAWLGTWVRLPFAWPRRLAPVAAAACVLLLLGAGPTVDDWLWRGNEAFGRRDFDAAIRCYRHALADADDPGQVAFDLGAAHFRKEDYAAAAEAYRQALDDGDLPASRRQRAWFDLGNALLAEGGITDRGLVEEAMTAYRHCLAAEPDPELRGDAEHNLALAGQRWLKTLPPNDNDPGNTPNASGKPSKEKKSKGSGDSEGPSTDSKKPPTGDPDSESPGQPKRGDGTNQASKGPITVLPELPDAADRTSLSAADAARHLEQAIGRIDRDRPPARPQDVSPRGKDW